MPPDSVLYEVTLEADTSLASAVEEHMRREHIPAILRTGCFKRIRFDQAAPGRFRTSYEAASAADLQRYLQKHAPALRAQFQAHFPTGVTLSRETWTPVEEWHSG